MTRDVWDSYMVVNHKTGQWDYISGDKVWCLERAACLGPGWKVVPVEIREKRRKKAKASS